MLSHLLTPKQRNDLAQAYNGANDMLFKITQKQVGNGIGTVLASIGIPLVLDALKGLRGGSAVRMGRGKGGAAVRIGRPSPFLGSWGEGGKGKGLLLGKNSPLDNIALVGAIL